MPEVLSELVARISADATELKRGLADAEAQTEKSSQNMAKSLKQIGIGLTAVGGTITAALGLMGKSAIDEEINIKRLATTMANAGVSYDAVRDSLEAIIETTQKKTNYSDTEQRDILNRLILVTNDYNKALELLPTTLDLAAAGGMDAATAATYLGKAYLDLESGAEQVSVRFGQASLQFKSMEDIQNRVAGAAKNMANPLNVLKNSFGDLAEKLGSFLIPIVKQFVDFIVPVIDNIKKWTDEHPELVKQLIILIGVVGAFAAVLGPILIMLPLLSAAFAFISGPIGIAIAAIMGLVAVGTLLWMNWDKVYHFLEDIWSNIKNAIRHAVIAVLDYLNAFVGWIPYFGEKIAAARENLSNLIDEERIKRDVRDTERELAKIPKAQEEIAVSNKRLSLSTKELLEAENARQIALQETINMFAESNRNIQEAINLNAALKAQQDAWAAEARHQYDLRGEAPWGLSKEAEAMRAERGAAAARGENPWEVGAASQPQINIYLDGGILDAALGIRYDAAAHMGG